MKYIISFLIFILLNTLSYSQEWMIKRDSLWNKYRFDYFIDWNSTYFITQSKVDSTSQIYMRISEKMKEISCEEGDKNIKEILFSGLSYPIQVNVNEGDVFYKIVPIYFDNSQFTKNKSVYYLDFVEYIFLLNNSKYLESFLGLPLSSVNGAYKVYIVKALQNTTIFKSYIAPTIQHLKENPSILYRTQGGVVQSLLLNICDPSIWEKNATDNILITPNIAPKY